MSIIKNILKDEKERLNLLKKQIEKQISSLPKGSLSKKRRNNRFYYYLAYRKGRKVIFEYVGKENSAQVISLSEDIQKRRKLEKRLRAIMRDFKEINRSIGER